jgi:hypothetical protein
MLLAPRTRPAPAAGRSLLLVSGGGHAGQEAMLEKARESMEAGGQLKEILAEYPS